LIYTCEKTIKDAGDKIKPESKKEVEEKIEGLKKVKDGQDSEALKKASQELEDTIQKIGAAMYQESKANVGPDQSAPSGQKESDSKEKDSSKENKNEEPIEGEFEEEPKK